MPKGNSLRRYRAERRNSMRRTRSNGKLGGIGPRTLREVTGLMLPKGDGSFINSLLGAFFKDK
jgi:hypothetical protein